MTYRKTWFDYVLLAVYSGICVLLLADTGYRFYQTCVGAPLAKLGMFLPFPVLFGLYPAIRLSSLAIRKRYSFSAHAQAMAEAFAVSVSFVFGTLIRLKEAIVWAGIYEEGAAVGFGAGEYYDRAVVKAGEGSRPLAHGMSDLFVRCLRLVFSFLGNSGSAAMLFQVVLQVAAMFFAYLAVKKAAGRFAACTLLLLLAFSGEFISRMNIMNPECLLLLLFLAGLYLTISFVRGALYGNGGSGSLPMAVFTGVVLGLLCYLELYCVILLVFLTGLLTGKSNVNGGRKRLRDRLFFALAGCFAGFFGAIALDALVSGISFYRGLTGWIKPYLHPLAFSLNTRANFLSISGKNSLFFIFLFVMAAFVVFSYKRGGREQIFSIWLLPCILVAPAFLFDFTVAGSCSLTLFFWYTIAAIGLQSVVFDGRAKLMQAKIEEINAAAEPIPATAIPAADAAVQKPRFLENPLPVPKKHVKKEMDYDYPVAPEMMHFDLELAEGDDFSL